MTNNKYIITGGGGSGKTSIINELNRIGFHTQPEISRQIIKEQQIINGNLLPWANLQGFGNKCAQEMQKQLSNSDQDITFFDRGIPDVLAYFNMKKYKLSDKYISSISNYSNTVFICPPWKSIFINDPQRPESFKYSSVIYQNLKAVYKSFDFNIIEVPKATIAQRVYFILEHLELTSSHLKGISNLRPSVAK